MARGPKTKEYIKRKMVCCLLSLMSTPVHPHLVFALSRPVTAQAIITVVLPSFRGWPASCLTRRAWTCRCGPGPIWLCAFGPAVLHGCIPLF